MSEVIALVSLWIIIGVILLIEILEEITKWNS